MVYRKKRETILFYMNKQLDTIFAVILSLYEYFKNEIATSYLFAGIIQGRSQGRGMWAMTPPPPWTEKIR